MKINYNLEMENIIKKLNYKPKLLIHSCCGPCSSAVIERLMENFQINILFYNPNLDSKMEWERRIKEQRKIIDALKKDEKINLIVPDFIPEEFLSVIRGTEKAPEGGKRCMRCYYLRLLYTGLCARDLDCDFWTTSLTISPHKDSQIINKMGLAIEKKTGAKFLMSDFKKKNGFKRSVELSQQYNLYRQDYCGCKFSKIEAENRNRNKSL